MPSASSASPTSVTMMTKDEPIPSNADGDTMNPRSCILQVGVSTGRLCGVANTHMSGKPQDNSKVLVLAMSELLHDVWRSSQSLQLDLILSIRNKLELNRRKYPVELCKGKSGKYTQYSKVTGVTTSNQSTLSDNHIAIPMAEFLEELPTLAHDIQIFSEARSWAQFHTARNIVLALLGEVGELAELVQWKGDHDNDDLNSPLTFEPKELDKLSQELADVSIYLLRLATVCDVVDPLCEALQD